MDEWLEGWRDGLVSSWDLDKLPLEPPTASHGELRYQRTERGAVAPEWSCHSVLPLSFHTPEGHWPQLSALHIRLGDPLPPESHLAHGQPSPQRPVPLWSLCKLFNQVHTVQGGNLGLLGPLPLSLPQHLPAASPSSQGVLDAEKARSGGGAGAKESGQRLK